MKHFFGKNLYGEAIGCFYRGATSLMVDGDLNDRVLS